MIPFRGKFWDLPGYFLAIDLAPRPSKTGLLGALGPAKSRSRLGFFSPRAGQDRSMSVPRPLQEAPMRPRRPKKGPRGFSGPILTPPGPPRTSKTMLWGLKFYGFEGAPGACKEHFTRHLRAVQDILRQACCVKSFPRYSKTSRPGLPFLNASQEASRSASPDVPGQASEGWAAVPRRRRLGLNLIKL